VDGSEAGHGLMSVFTKKSSSCVLVYMLGLFCGNVGPFDAGNFMMRAW